MATFNFAPYSSASSDVGKALPGTIALRDAIEARLPALGPYGLYRDDYARNGRYSSHNEGRAVDAYMPDRRPHPAGDQLVDLLGPHGRALGIEYMIYNRRIWSARTPGGRDYERSDYDPHTDHVHITLTRDAARTLTPARITDLLGDDMFTDKDRAMLAALAAQITYAHRQNKAIAAMVVDLGADPAKVLPDGQVVGADGSPYVADGPAPVLDEAALAATLAEALAPTLVPAIVAALAEQGVTLTDEQIRASTEAALRSVLGSLDQEPA